MKKLLICICAIFFGLNPASIFAQCGNDNSLVAGDLTPPGPSSPISLTIGAGQYVTAYVFAGVNYQVSTCGGSGFDTQLTVYDDAFGTLMAYNDDYCGLQSTVSFTPAACGYIRILLDQYSCNNSGLMMAVNITQNTVSSTDATITCAPDTTVMAEPGMCTASVILNTPTVTCGHSLSNNAPPVFPVGTTAVTWQVIGDNDTATCIQNVIVIDNQLPVITLCSPDTALTTDPGVCQASGVTLNLTTATDNCGISTITNDAPADFPEGITVVTWTVTDVNGNATTCTQNVTVTDDENPVITCPNDTTLATDAGLCSATPSDVGIPLVSDNCNVDSTWNDAPATFPKGITTVNWMVVDIHGLTATCAQVVTVIDTELPVITCPANISITANYDSCTAIVTWAPLSVSDNCAVDTVFSTHNSGDTLLPGTYTVTYTAIDESGNTAMCSFDIAVLNTLTASVTTATDLTCNGDLSGAIDVSTTGGTLPYVYDWDNDGTGDLDDAEDLSGLSAGTYVLTVSDSIGCIATLSQSLTEPAALNISFTATDLTCNGDLSGAIDVSTTGGTLPYMYDWDNDGTGDNDDTEDLSGLSAGTYVLTVSDSVGCTATLSQSLTEPTALNISFTTTPQSSTTPNGAIDLSVSGGVSPYTYDWSNDGTGDNDDTQDLSGLTAGTYTVIVTDSNGCTETGDAVVTSTVGMSEWEKNNVVQVYPNPNNGLFTIAFSTYAESTTVLEIYNTVGDKIYTSPINGSSTPVSLNGINGLVWVRIQQNGAYIYSTAVMIQR